MNEKDVGEEKIGERETSARNGRKSVERATEICKMKYLIGLKVQLKAEKLGVYHLQSDIYVNSW